MWEFLKKSKAILGLNARNLDFVRTGNKKSALDIVDNKLKTKRLLRKFDLPVAELLGVIKNRRDFYNFDWQSLPNSFVLKPNRGLGGEGIMVTFGRKKNGLWILPHERTASLEDIMAHVRDILDGRYSMSNAPDAAFFEERLKIHPAFKLYSYKGIPDVRVIVYNKVPVMAMLRLPTRASHGTANLHKGGLGLGVDIVSGQTTVAIQYDRAIAHLPDLKLSLSGLQIPEWDRILEIAVTAADACGLNYAGVDIALDREKGPVILELNGHPGLSIQIANLAPLKDRLRRVQGLKIKIAKKGIKVARELFGSEWEHEMEVKTGKKILGVINPIRIKGKSGEWVEVEAKMDTGAGISALDEELARRLGFGEAVDYYRSFGKDGVLTKEEAEDLKKEQFSKKLLLHPDIVDCAIVYSSHGVSYRPEVDVKLVLDGREVAARASIICREHLKYPVIVGRRDLKNFLIDPAR